MDKSVIKLLKLQTDRLEHYIKLIHANYAVVLHSMYIEGMTMAAKCKEL